MLNYTERYINFLAAFITVFIFMVIIIFDVHWTKNNANYQEKVNRMNISSISIKKNHNTHIENTYTEVVKQVGNFYKNQEDKEVKVSENEDISENTNEINNEKSSNQSQQSNQTENINIYSTNKWRIKIPKLKLDAPITEGTTQEAMRRTVGHFENTDKWNGNVALAAHNRGYKCNFFQEIKTLQKGDVIIYSTEKGERKYEVVVNKVIEETDWSYIQNTKDNRITLITCETNRKAYRRCIQAVEII